MDSLCTACLCAERNLYYLSTDVQCFNIFKQILNEIQEMDLSLITLRVCWECYAVLKHFSKFKASALTAYHKLLEALQHGEQDINHIAQEPHLKICKVTETILPITLTNVKIEKESTTDLLTEVKTEPTCPLEIETHNEPETFVNNLQLTSSLERKLKRDLRKVKKRKLKKRISSDEDMPPEIDFNSDNSSDCSPIIELKQKKPKKKMAKQKKDGVAKNDSRDDKPQTSMDKTTKKSKLNENNLDKAKTDSSNVLEGEKDVIEDIVEVTLTPEEVAREREEDMKSDKFVRSKYVCNSCVMVFKSWLELQEHNRTCHDESVGAHVCPTCSRRFVSGPLAAEHARAHGRRWDCARCGRRARAQHELHAHLHTHRREDQEYVCDVCHLVSRSLSQHQLHKSKVHDEKPQCVECGKVFSSRKTYRYHLNVLHKGQNRFPCPHCGKVYQWKSNLWRHIKNHKAKDTGELYCAPCDKKFSSIATYRQHIKISRRHVSESEFNFICNTCGRKFVSKSKLRDHEDWEHLNKINYRCQLCDKPFKSATSLYVHLQNVHRHKEEKDNLCHVCGKSYQSTAKLKYHIVAMHSGETPYSCKLCAASFSWYSSLYRHVREVHDKIKVNKKPRKTKRMIELLTTLPQQ